MDLAIWDDLSMEISGTSTVRVALVGDSVDELLRDEGPVVMTFGGHDLPCADCLVATDRREDIDLASSTVPVNNEIANADLPT
jgi:hypothetical protein